MNAGERVYFESPGDVARIFGRVTGSDVSNILGTLGVDGPADLFLLNPRGILFGPDAQLDMAGSFTATTAEGLVFGDDFVFSTVDAGAVPSMLTVNIVPGLQVGMGNGGIETQGPLQVDGDLRLAAGHLDLQGPLEVDGDVNLESWVGDIVVGGISTEQTGGNVRIDSQGKITANGEINTSAPLGTAGDVRLRADGDISFRERANILASGAVTGNVTLDSGGDISLDGNRIQTNMTTDQAGLIGGDIEIRAAGDISIINGGEILVTNSGSGNTGEINLLAQEAVRIAGENSAQRRSRVENRIASNSDGNAGSINIEANNLRIDDGATIIAVTDGQGDIDKIMINANDSVTILGETSQGFKSSIFSTIRMGAQGNSSGIDISADSLTVRDGASISSATSGFGNSGKVIISLAGDLVLEGLNREGENGVIRSIVSRVGEGNSGGVEISSNNLILRDGGYLGASTLGQGNAGKISIIVNDMILLEGQDQSDSLFTAVSHIASIVSIDASGISEGIEIMTDSLILRGGTGIATITDGQGNAGPITILVNEDFIVEDKSAEGLGSSVISGAGARAEGNSGDIQISAGSFFLRDGGSVITSNLGRGQAGSVSLRIDENLELEGQDEQGNGSLIVSEAGINIEFSHLQIAQINQGELLLEVQLDTQTSPIDINALLAIDRGQLVEAQPGSQASPIDITAPHIVLKDRARISSSATGEGSADDITIQGQTLEATGGSQLLSQTRGSQRAGNIILNLDESVAFAGAESGIFANTATGSSGRGGSIAITTPTLSLTDGVELSASTAGSGNAGDIRINANQFDLRNGATIQTNTTHEGNAGDIILTTDTLNLSNGGSILAETSGNGSGGTVTVNARNQAILGDGGQEATPVVSVETSSGGRAGDIRFNTPNFTLAETARITATATATATNEEDGGSITINANTMDLAGVVGIFAETQGQAPAGTLTLQPYQNQPNLDLTLAPGATISASTSGSGQGGGLRAFAPQTLTIGGPGKLAVETTGTGDAGNLNLRAATLNLTDGVEVSASTFSSGRAGNINLTATDLALTNGALVRTNTFSSGDAGNIKVDVTHEITIDDSSIEARTEDSSTGNGGDIDIDPILTTIANDGRVAVDSEGSGIGGDIRLVSDNLVLSNRGRITAETRSSDGGNITLTVPQLLQLLDNSVISTEAGTAQAGGNGGNITIDAGFLIGSTNSDIITNAFAGNGGVVTINAQGIINLLIENHAAPRTDPRNNVTANSIQANVGILNVDAETVEATAELPDAPRDLSNQIDRSCTNSNNHGKFIHTGRGGLPPQPNDIFASGRPLADLGPDLDPNVNSGLDQSNDRPTSPTPLTLTSPAPIIEAQTIQFGANGEVHLVAESRDRATIATALLPCG